MARGLAVPSERFHEFREQLFAAATPAQYVKMTESFEQADSTADLAGISCPVGLIADLSTEATARQVRVASSVLRQVGTFHGNGPFPSDPDGYFSALREFLTPWMRQGPADAGESVAQSAFRTILFTDVVSSTPLLAQLKDAKMREVMRDHDEVLNDAVTGRGGRVIKTIGDAFMAEFATPSASIEAAIAAQRGIRERFAGSEVPIRIRIGINAGEPIEEDGDLHGTSVVIAKRLESAADHGGILVSDVVKQMVTGKDFDFEDRGPVQLKGFDEPVHAWAVRW
ncbi:MAG: adenylate/guanylate cyclase domain-containing protein [Dehalococcoidia bacterium]|nr:adenylate/guanylate cyclase domain-containing protein [Dehalococcoidia bacterium]MCB9487048.1 adenylate/guanylate cyclase domain-containing protein [Thermoflexaceae bacterium]